MCIRYSYREQTLPSTITSKGEDKLVPALKMSYPFVGVSDVVVELFDGVGSGRAEFDFTQLQLTLVGWTQGQLGEHEHEAVTLTDRQTNRQTNRQTDRQTDRHKC